jgi:tetratricopeptide (TPR) repeat protein
VPHSHSYQRIRSWHLSNELYLAPVIMLSGSTIRFLSGSVVALDVGPNDSTWFGIWANRAQRQQSFYFALLVLSMFRRRWLSIFLIVLAAASLQSQQPAALQDARQAMEAGKYTTAEQLYRKSLTQTPSSPELLTDLGLSLQMQGRLTDSMHYYALALQQRYIPETYALLAQEKCRMGERDSLKPMLDRIYLKERKNFRVLAAVAPCYLDIDKPIESVVVYQALLGNDTYPADLALIQLAKSYLHSGQFFASKLDKAPGSEPYLAALRQASGDGSAGARSAFPQAARISSYFRSDLSWTEAVERWRQHPQDVALLYLLSVLSGEESMRQIEICTERYPASPYLQQLQADVLADQGRADEAAQVYEQLMQRHPELPDLADSLGLLFEKAGAWEKAAETYRQQIARDSKDERAVAHLSECLFKLGQYAELRDLLQPEMRVEHSPQWAKVALAEADEELGDPQTAIKLLVSAENDANADKLVHYRLIHLYSITGRPADAKRELALFHAASGK